MENFFSLETRKHGRTDNPFLGWDSIGFETILLSVKGVISKVGFETVIWVVSQT
jgi:hypothetical protein